MTVHHRNPRSRGGSNDKSNKSNVLCYKHQAYHCLFDSYEVPDMCRRFQFYFDLFWNHEIKSSEQNEKLTIWLHGHRKRDASRRENRLLCWDYLFANHTVEQILFELNNVWINPMWVITQKVSAGGQITFLAQAKYVRII